MIGRAVCALLGFACFIGNDAAAAELPLTLGQHRISTSVKSLLEIRDDKLVRQGWDISCGAAALSTILTYNFGTPYSELTIAVSILANTDPQKVRDRGGFSMLDLKRFAEAVGYQARGFGGLTIDDLTATDAPSILPVRIRGLDHFVVFRDRVAGKVLLGDPAFGNLIVSERRFQEMWQSGIGLFVTRSEELDSTGKALSPGLMNTAIPNLNYVYRVSQGLRAPPVRRR